MAAMADKAGAVAAGLTGRRVRFAGEEVISRLRDQVVRFREQVLGRADFVVVTRSGDVVRAETLRLRDELGARGCRVRAVLDVGGLAKSEGAEATHTVPAADDLVGCDGLRAWGSPARTEGASPVPPDARRGAAITEALGGRSLYLFAGKGGVGKSTCAAAFGLALGQATGREVLLLGTDPAGSLGDVLGVPIGSSDTRVTSALVARELDAEAELEAFRERYRDRIRGVFRRLGIGDAELDRRVLESFIELAPPGIDEIFALDAILEQTGEQQVLVVDAAPTGHLLRLLEMPELARSWSHAVLGVLLKYRSVLGLDDFASQLLRFARRVDGLIELLRDDRRVGIVVVTLDGVLPGRETTRLARALHDADLPVAALVLNRSMGAPPEMEGGAARVVPLTIRAPAVDPPPVGPDRLVEFLDRWSVA
jgi:arsenite-transporting ATPase